MCKSFMPTLAELYREERGPMNRRKAYSPGNSGNAMRAITAARLRLAQWHEAFPDRIEGDKLARFLLAKSATGARLNRLIPAWAKPQAVPKPPKSWAGQPPKFPAWVGTCYPNALYFHNSHA